MPHPIGYFKTRPRSAPDWIIPGWLKRGNTGFIIGQPKKACKSWLLLNLAWDLSEGKPLWSIVHSKNGAVFEPPRPFRVVYFTQEDSEDDVQDRVDLLLAAGRQPNNNFWVVSKNLQIRLDDNVGLGHVEKELNDVLRDAGPIDLILFDPMRRMHQGDENSSEVIAKLWPLLDQIHQKYHCATIFSHHIVKPPTTKGHTFDVTQPYAARGSGDIYGGGDAFINVDPQNMHGRATTQRALHLHFETKRGKAITAVAAAVDFTTGGVKFLHMLP